MSLEPLHPSLIIAAKLRRMAADLILQAEELEALVPRNAEESGRHTRVFFKDIKPKRNQG